jgi:hypothetical protein
MQCTGKSTTFNKFSSTNQLRSKSIILIVIPCSSEKASHFRGTYHLHFQSWRVSQARNQQKQSQVEILSWFEWMNICMCKGGRGHNDLALALWPSMIYCASIFYFLTYSLTMKMEVICCYKRWGFLKTTWSEDHTLHVHCHRNLKSNTSVVCLCAHGPIKKNCVWHTFEAFLCHRVGIAACVYLC